MSDPVTVVEIKISSMINDDGTMTFRLITPKEYDRVELLGLLEAAKWQIFRDMNRSEDRRREP